jgi:hypothetical protein
MENSIYQVNKGINKSIEFKGLRAQYIWYLGGGLLGLLILFAVMYIIGISSLVCIGIVLISGTGLFIKVYAMSNRYGEHGLMKKIASGSIPKTIKNNSRKVFQSNLTRNNK